ncbi:hypothetical protein Moror_12024 [Moniliophthora roreri MCA 2997]|uniref:Uncharacterized protein n=1 Tax=Moniliophthora roreri (strain MCA 2997) TaxID=1381753 RepID=V2WTY8_MONRO|nr:hypothetical protein Moror_12024 [Moniliophthora roreri MCA 2997]
MGLLFSQNKDNEPKLSVSVQPTATINVPGSVVWTWSGGQGKGGPKPVPAIFLVPDGPSRDNPRNKIEVPVSPGQTKGTFAFTATQTGKHHFEADFNLFKITGGPIDVIQTSTSIYYYTTIIWFCNNNRCNECNADCYKWDTKLSVRFIFHNFKDTGTQTGPSYTPSYTPSSTSTTSTSGDTATPQPKSQSTQIIILGAVLGSLFGVFIVISLLLFYIRHRRRRSSRDTPNIGFNKEKMVSRRWWHSSHYSFRDAKKSQIDSEAASRSEYQSEWDDTFESLAPSDSVSQVQSKSKRNLNDKRTLPPLPSNNLSVVSEKVEA